MCTKESGYPNQTRYAEETETRVSMTPWSIESRNHEHEMESQCRNQQGGYALVWMHNLRMGKLSMQNDLWKVSVWCKLSSHKNHHQDERAMPQCKYLQIKRRWEECNQSYIIWSKWTSARQSHRGNVKRISDLPQRKSMSQCEADISKINRQWKGYALV